MSNPYRDQAINYLEQGWRGVLPLPAGAKWPPPNNYTGRGNDDPDLETISQWLATHNGNICLRMPADVIGLDIDAYGDKKGAYTLQMLELELGYLAATWRITSRDDGTSGIRLFKVPPGLKWPSIAGEGIEFIRREHRYAVAPPSIHPNGGTYKWINPHDTIHIGQPPKPQDLPPLHPEWVKHFTGNRKDNTTNIETLNGQQIDQLTQQILTAGNQCAQAQQLMQEFMDIMDGNAGSRHDACLNITLKAVSLGARGHHGIKDLLDTCEHIFTNIIGLDRGISTARQEWQSMVKGAIERNPTIKPEPCLDNQCSKDITNYILQLPTPDDTQIDIDDKATWQPIDLMPIFLGERQPEQPTVLQRDDQQFLLYPNKIHSIYGEPESGKSLIIQYEAARLIAAGKPVLYIDCESDEHTTIDRLKRFGLIGHQLEHFTYIRPERSWKASITEHEAWKTIIDCKYELAIIDGVTEALTMFGFETNDNDGITKFMRLIPRQIARHTGAATVLIDHIAKNSSSRFAIGGQAKLAAIDGAAYLIDIIEPISIGSKGRLKMSITKDRPGRIRGNCISDNERNTRVQTAAIISIDSIGNNTTVNIGMPDPHYKEHKIELQVRKDMIVLSHWLKQTFGTNSFSAADYREGSKEKSGLSKNRADDAFKALKDEGCIVTSGDDKANGKPWKQINYYVDRNQE